MATARSRQHAAAEAVSVVKQTKASQRRGGAGNRQFHRAVAVSGIHGALLFGTDPKHPDENYVVNLIRETGFSRRELYAMFMQFKALVAMSHSIEGVDKTAFLRGIPMLSMEDREFVERVFSLLDEDGSGIIEWQEFLLALTKLEHGTPMTRASFLFDVYDDDGGGTIEDEEMMHYFLASMRLTDETASDYFKDICKYFVSRVLSEIDPDHEGHLDRNRIVKFLQEHPDTTNVGGLFGRANVEVSATASVLQKNNIHLEQMLLSKDSHLPLEWTKAMHKEEKRRRAKRDAVFARAAEWRKRKAELEAEKATSCSAASKAGALPALKGARRPGTGVGKRPPPIATAT